MHAEPSTLASFSTSQLTTLSTLQWPSRPDPAASERTSLVNCSIKCCLPCFFIPLLPYPTSLLCLTILIPS
ncbi:hypothetical protein BDV06DRAFT_203901 [Aspergillus oleicola]